MAPSIRKLMNRNGDSFYEFIKWRSFFFIFLQPPGNGDERCDRFMTGISTTSRGIRLSWT